MQATARRLSVVSATSCARRRLIRSVRPTNSVIRRSTNMNTSLLRNSILTLFIASLIGWTLSPWVAGLLTDSIHGQAPSNSGQTLADRISFSLSFGTMSALALLASRWTHHPRLTWVTHPAAYWLLGLLGCSAAIWLFRRQIDISRLDFSFPSSLSHSTVHVFGEIHFGPVPTLGMLVIALTAVVLRLLGTRLPPESSAQ
jgi:hypothetical protein